jgi:co-chaperonin GroES (HSP10)
MKLTHLPQAYGKNIIIRLDKQDNTTDGGIILTSSLSKFATAEVVSVPEAYCVDFLENSENDEIEALIEIGERVMFYGNLFGTFEFQGDIYGVLKYSEVVAKL